MHYLRHLGSGIVTAAPRPLFDAHMNAIELAASTHPSTKLRGEILSETEFNTWFNTKLALTCTSLSEQQQDERVSFYLDLSEHDFDVYVTDFAAKARVGLHVLECTPEESKFVTDLFGPVNETSEHDGTWYFEWLLPVCDWPFITTHIIGEALRHFKNGVAVYDTQALNLCLRRHYPSSNYEYLKNWYMADLFDLDDNANGAQVLCDVLRQQTWAKTPWMLGLPDDLYSK